MCDSSRDWRGFFYPSMISSWCSRAMSSGKSREWSWEMRLERLVMLYLAVRLMLECWEGDCLAGCELGGGRELIGS